jgi:hypothetical protein
LSSAVSSQTFGLTAEAAEDFAEPAEDIEISPLPSAFAGDHVMAWAPSGALFYRA